MMATHTVVVKLEVLDETKPDKLAQLEMTYIEREVSKEDMLAFEGTLAGGLVARMAAEGK